MVVSAEKARQKAEARRLRILAKANERLDVVSGLVPSSDVSKVLDVSDDVKESPVSSPREDSAGDVDGGATQTGSSASPGEEKENKGSKRMSAMRRRRAQQRAAKEGEKEAEAADGNEGQAAPKTASDDVFSSAVIAGEKSKRATMYDLLAETKMESAVFSRPKSDPESPTNEDVSSAAKSAPEELLSSAVAAGERSKRPTVDDSLTETKTESAVFSRPKTDNNSLDAVDISPKKSDEPETNQPPSLEIKQPSTKTSLPTTSETSTEPKEERRSYMGVAKMRRKILKQQKSERLQSITDSEALHSADAQMERELVAEIAAMGVTAKMVREGVDVCDGSFRLASSKKRRGWLARLLPTVYTFSRLVTLMVLFGAGFRIGVETHYGENGGGVERSVPAVANAGHTIHHVESTLTKPWERGIGGKVANLMGKMPSAAPTALPAGFQDETHNGADEFDTGRARPRGVSDEFEEDVPKKSNIDPLFRADLDELLAKSELPFPIDHAARFAIGFHRMWMYYLWTLPISTVKTISSTPKTILGGWIRYPPVVLMFTLLVRLVNRILLGGGKKMEEDGVKDKGKGGMDVMKKVMESAKSYIEGSFPWLVFIFSTFYDVAKRDMYVVFCGMMVGLVMPLHEIGLSLGFGGGTVLGDGEL